MFTLDFYYKMKTSDGLTMLELFKSVFRGSQTIVSGLEVTATTGTEVIISSGSAMIASKYIAKIINDADETVELADILSEKRVFTTVPDGNHPLVLSFDTNTQRVYLTLILEFQVGKFDNPPSEDYVILGIVQVSSGSITDIIDSYGSWERVESELSFGSGGSGTDDHLVLSDNLDTTPGYLSEKIDTTTLDVDTTSHTIKVKDGVFADISHSHNVGDLSDVNLSSLTMGNILKYDDSMSAWVNSTLTSNAPSGTILIGDGTDGITYNSDVKVDSSGTVIADYFQPTSSYKSDAGSNGITQKIPYTDNGGNTRYLYFESGILVNESSS